MQNLNVYAPRLIPKEEPFAPGHRACIGCGEVLAVRLATKAMGKNVIIVNAMEGGPEQWRQEPCACSLQLGLRRRQEPSLQCL